MSAFKNSAINYFIKCALKESVSALLNSEVIEADSIVESLFIIRSGTFKA